MRIGTHETDEKVLIIAEVGNNHEGSFDNAVKLVHAAKQSGADAVKFQTFKTELFTSPADPTRVERLKKFELSQDELVKLHGLSRELGLVFISTPLDLESARFLEPLVAAFKIASGDNDFFPLIRQVCGTGKPVIISTGLADQERVVGTARFAHEVWQEHGIAAQLAILHCVSSYPVPPEQANVRAVVAIREALEAAQISCTVGYSDHTDGVEACLAAVALGARVVEKHFTLDKHFSDFRDHQLSADPPEMRRLVDSIRRVEAMLGSGNKVLQDAEQELKKVARRSIYFARDLPAGHTVAMDDLLWLRPANGLPPGQEDKLIGKQLKEAVARGTLASPDQLRGRTATS
jgi:sialic acid synthase SpsE